MDPKKFLQADYLDIIFSHRNKAYGGYELRKHYSRRAKKAGMFVMLGLSALISFSFALGGRKKADVPAPVYVNHMTDIIPPTVPPTPPPPKPTIVHPASHTAKLTVFKITDEPVKPDELPTEIKKIGDAVPGSANVDSSLSGGPASSGGKGQPVAVAGIGKPSTPPIWVEIMPSFSGDIKRYLSEHLRYPDQAREANIQGQVIVQFIVNEDGSVSDAKVMRSIGGGCDEEAARVVSQMPHWKPGRQNNVNVKVLYSLPVRFILQ